MTFLTNAGEWAAGLTLDAIPPRVVEKIRLQIATDVSAAAFSPWHDAANRILRARRSSGDALVFATGERVAPRDAAFINAAFAMSLDYDDYMLTGHTGYSAALVPLAFAESLDDVVVAAVCANELMGRLSTASLLGPLNGQMSSYIHNLGAAVALGKMRQLPARELAHAAALALYQPNFCLVPGFWTEGAKTTTASMPIELGIRAVELASEGVEGPLDLFEHPLGFSSVFSFNRYPGIFGALGRVWLSDTLCYKRYPGTSYISAGVEGALELSGGRAMRASEIESITIETQILSSTLDSVGQRAIERTPLDANAVNFSLRLSVATALCFGDLTPTELQPDTLAAHEAEIRAICSKIEVVHDWAQSARMFAAAPLGIGMLVHQDLAGLAKLVHHTRQMNRAGGRSPNKSTLSGLFAELPRLAKLALKMRQSARVRLRAAGVDERVFVEIPVGACGRDAEEARQIVRWRCENAFGESGEALFETLMRPGARTHELGR